MALNQNNRVGLGTFPLSGVYNRITAKEAENIVRGFIERGGFYIDTAPLYGLGEVEKLLGKVLRQVPRNKYYICTKTIKHIDETGRLFISGKYNDVIKQIDNSLSRLRLDYVDLLMIHSPDSSVPTEETLKAMEKLQQDGKVRALAVSNLNLDELKIYNQTGRIKYVQNRFSMINRSITSEMGKYLLENKIYLIPYQLLEIGLLTGLAFEGFRPDERDLRHNLPYWTGRCRDEVYRWVRESLGPIARKMGITIGQLNIAWNLAQPFIDFVIVGVTNPEYLEINLKADSIVIPTQIQKILDNEYRTFESNIRTNYNLDLKDFRGLNDKFY